jgi:hypothetical protein
LAKSRSDPLARFGGVSSDNDGAGGTVVVVPGWIGVVVLVVVEVGLGADVVVDTANVVVVDGACVVVVVVGVVVVVVIVGSG